MSRIWTDRMVHGRTVEGYLIVRYDHSGKWYIEPLSETGLDRWRVSVLGAAITATAGTHYPGKPGGTRFDALVKSALSERQRS